MSRAINLISLFDGISCARVALERAGIDVNKYRASEVDKYAIAVSNKNRPDIIHLGDVNGVGDWEINEPIDLIIWGSPCQDLSIAKKDRKGLDGARSGLFYKYVEAIEKYKPKYFILENVASMRPEDRDIISGILWVQPIMINAALVSAQNRKRYFWTNIPNMPQPDDLGIILNDVLEDGTTDRLKSYCIDANYWKGSSREQYTKKWRRQLIIKSGVIRIWHLNKWGQGDRIYSVDGKSVCLSANGVWRGAKTGLYFTNDQVRKLTPKECERLQGLPDWYTDPISNTQRYRCLGNAFNVDVVTHILKYLPIQ